MTTMIAPDGPDGKRVTVRMFLPRAGARQIRKPALTGGVLKDQPGEGVRQISRADSQIR
jgi:hypothetical protein